MKTALLAIALLAALPAAAAPPVALVFLDRPGELDRIARENPDHFRRITGIIEASAQACRRDEVGQQVRVRFEAVKTTCGAFIKTSYPAKFTLSFQLDQTQYHVTATQPTDEKLVAVPTGR